MLNTKQTKLTKNPAFSFPLVTFAALCRIPLAGRRRAQPAPFPSPLFLVLARFGWTGTETEKRKISICASHPGRRFVGPGTIILPSLSEPLACSLLKTGLGAAVDRGLCYGLS